MSKKTKIKFRRGLRVVVTGEQSGKMFDHQHGVVLGTRPGSRVVGVEFDECFSGGHRGDQYLGKDGRCWNFEIDNGIEIVEEEQPMVAGSSDYFWE